MSCMQVSKQFHKQVLSFNDIPAFSSFLRHLVVIIIVYVGQIWYNGIGK